VAVLFTTLTENRGLYANNRGIIYDSYYRFHQTAVQMLITVVPHIMSDGMCRDRVDVVPHIFEINLS
jgi:hypothetical protein